MQKYDVHIRWSVSTAIEVQAGSAEEAERIAEQSWREGQVSTSPENCSIQDFEVDFVEETDE